jgi:TRAP-type C4-dicarboxylate transport system permease small subunit
MIPLFKALDEILGRLEEWLMVCFLALMVVFTFLFVLLRALHLYAHLGWANAVIGQVDWTQPLVRLLVLWVTFLGASLLTRENRHIKIDLTSLFMPSRWRPFKDVFLSAACVIVSAIMVKTSFQYIQNEYLFGTHLFLSIPAWVGQIILPIGFLCILFRFLLRGITQTQQLMGRTRP